MIENNGALSIKTAQAYFALGSFYSNKSRYSLTIENYELALKIYIDNFGKDWNEELLEVLYSIWMNHLWEGKFEELEQMKIDYLSILTKLVRKYKIKFGNDLSDLPSVKLFTLYCEMIYDNYTSLDDDMDEYKENIDLFLEALPNFIAYKTMYDAPLVLTVEYFLNNDDFLKAYELSVIALKNIDFDCAEHFKTLIEVFFDERQTAFKAEDEAYVKAEEYYSKVLSNSQVMKNIRYSKTSVLKSLPQINSYIKTYIKPLIN